MRGTERGGTETQGASGGASGKEAASSETGTGTGTGASTSGEAAAREQSGGGGTGDRTEAQAAPGEDSEAGSLEATSGAAIVQQQDSLEQKGRGSGDAAGVPGVQGRARRGEAGQRRRWGGEGEQGQGRVEEGEGQGADRAVGRAPLSPGGGPVSGGTRESLRERAGCGKWGKGGGCSFSSECEWCCRPKQPGGSLLPTSIEQENETQKESLMVTERAGGAKTLAYRRRGTAGGRGRQRN